MSRHVTFIEIDLESFRRGGSTRTATCVCGWRGPERGTLELAADDALGHERSTVSTVRVLPSEAYADDRLCMCGHPFGHHCGVCRGPERGAHCALSECSCKGFRPRVLARHRQLTGAAYIHHAYVYDGNKVVMACAHRHGAQRSHNPVTGEVKNQGGPLAQACAERMLRKYLKHGAKGRA